MKRQMKARTIIQSLEPKYVSNLLTKVGFIGGALEFKERKENIKLSNVLWLKRTTESTF